VSSDLPNPVQNPASPVQTSAAQRNQGGALPKSLTEEILGREFVNAAVFAKILAWPEGLRASFVSVLFASLVLLPYLGAVGLWDPWETHYGEVAREMIQRNDYVHPYWENAWFFSKPVFTMWMQSLGLQAASVGVILALILALISGGLGFALYTNKFGKSENKEFFGALLASFGIFMLTLFIWGKSVALQYKFGSVDFADDAMPLFTEWGFRLPFTLFSIMAIGFLTYAMTVAVNARAALATAFVLTTMPLYFLLSRQAVTDTPIVAATICGISCAIVGLFDKQSKFKSEWWYGAYFFFAVATLAKGLLGFGVPMVVYILFVAATSLGEISRTWSAHLKWISTHMAAPLTVGLGAGACAFVIAQTLGAKWDTTFMAVPVIDNVSKISAPVWLGIMWGSLVFWAVTTLMMHIRRHSIAQAMLRSENPPPKLFAIAYEMRLGTGLLLFLAVCLPWYYEMFTFWRVDDEGKIFWFRFIIHDHFARLGSGVHTTTPGGDFTYFIQQGGFAMFPWVVLVPGAIAAIARLRVTRDVGADAVGLIAVLWFVVSWGLIGASATKFHHYVFPMLPPLAILMGIFVARVWDEGVDAHLMVLLFGAPIFMLVGKDLAATPKNFTDLFVYNYDRPYPQDLVEKAVLGANNIKQLMGMGMTLFGVAALIFALRRARVWLYTTGLVAALSFALWFNWSHWVQLSHNWTQRDQFWRYYTQRRPNEPIAAFLMNWRGETFYSRNTVKQLKDNANVGMQLYSQQPGREWSLVEHNRLGILQSAVGDKKVTKIDADLNNKFVLVTIE
jgi:4-amino-4-deoxy-L-arabinose transferase-like glycosyltransferase